MPSKRTSKDIRDTNRFAVLRGLYSVHSASRQELAAATGLSFATIANIVKELVDAGVLIEAGRESSRGGRPVTRLALAPDRGALVGVDVAETYIRAVVYDLKLEALASVEEPLADGETDPDALATAVADAVGDALGQSGVDRDKVLGAGVSLPGQVDPKRGVSVFAPNWDWHEVRIQKLLEKHLALPVHVDNPLHAIAVAELWFGHGRDADNLVVVNLGTGVGAGIALDGELVRGASNTAGEWGHSLLQFGGRGCRCGRRGCVEAYLGAPGIKATMVELAPGHSSLATETQKDFVEAVAAGLAGGDEDCRQLVDTTGRYLAAALGDLVNLFNPQFIAVLGWTAGPLGAALIKVAREHLASESLPGPGSVVQLGSSSVPGDAVALGMATFALEGFIEQPGRFARVALPIGK
jgi:predicted NBD/HSP70 family sugar kinase/biotin operon repressor